MKLAAPASCPSDTMNTQMKEHNNTFTRMKFDITLSWVELKDLLMTNQKSIPLCKFITKKQLEYKLDLKTHYVSTTCMYSSMEQKRLEVYSVGVTTPVLDTEPLIIMLIKLSSDCNNTFTKSQIIELTNHYIKGTEIE